MSDLIMWSFTPTDLEQEGVAVMTTTISALVKEGIFEEEKALDWLRTHTMIMRKPSWFSRLFKPSEKEKHLWCVVKLIREIHAIE